MRVLDWVAARPIASAVLVFAAHALLADAAFAQTSNMCPPLPAERMNLLTQAIDKVSQTADALNKRDRDREKIHLAAVRQALDQDCRETVQKAVVAIGDYKLPDGNEAFDTWAFAVRIEANILEERRDFDGAEKILSMAAEKSASRFSIPDLCRRSFFGCVAILRLRQGWEHNDVAAFEKAALIYRDQLLPEIDKLNHRDQGNLLLYLGSALNGVGTRRLDPSGIPYLNDSAVALERALALISRDEFPGTWAMGQWNLGSTLTSLAERSGKGSEAMYERAISANRSALEILTSAKAPEPWASVQTNLAIGLAYNGQRATGARAIGLLTDAVSGFTYSLRVYTKETKPEFWADIQSNLGSALQQLANRKPNAEKLPYQQQAVAAFNNALEISTRQDRPIKWVNASAGLAVVLADMSLSDPANAKRYLSEAEKIVSETIIVFNEQKDQSAVAAQTKLLAQIRQARAGLK